MDNIDLLTISDRLCFIGFNIVFISVIGISVECHGTPLLSTTYVYKSEKPSICPSVFFLVQPRVGEVTLQKYYITYC